MVADISAEYSLDEVAKHNSREDCYTAVNGNVYNLTDAISKHPGGADAISKLCGIDGTQIFENQHGGQEKPEAGLAGLQIGVLK